MARTPNRSRLAILLLDLPPEHHEAGLAIVFCVVGVQTGDDFDRHATSWP